MNAGDMATYSKAVNIRQGIKKTAQPLESSCAVDKN